MFAADTLTQLIKIVLLTLTVCTALISLKCEFTEHVGEYFALLLLATVGMMFLVSSENLLGIFVSLELTSLSLYILTAFNKQSISSAEAALKYFLFGGMAAAFTLFGLSLLYGLTGEINLRAIAGRMAGQTYDPLFLLALVMSLIGFGFKIAAVPFHLWAPDAYEGAPTPVAALIASGSKVASFFILAKVMLIGFAGAEGNGGFGQFAPGWMPVLAALALMSVFAGNLAAIAQKNVKRLLAYSAIAHAGYMLLAVIVSGYSGKMQQGLASLIYYAATYALTTIGAFGVVSLVEYQCGDAQFSSFAGLSKRSPIASFCMMIFMLSLAGIPPLAGFFGKFYIFTAAIGAEPKNFGLLWLVVISIAMSAVSLYYYLQVLKQIYVVDTNSDTTSKCSIPTTIAIVLLAIAVVLFGCVPRLFLEPLEIAMKSMW
jgi:NADH-quinone oxidoreductase subunit N